MPRLRTSLAVPAFALIAVTALTGCHVSSHGKNGKEDVAIDTPLGNFAVKTDPAAVLERIGLPSYPGATPVKEKGSDKDSADVNLSFGSFHLRVQAAGFESTDERSKVQAFYRKALQQYSDVIACQDEKPVGEPTKTGMGLTCKDDKHSHSHIHTDMAKTFGPELVLKAGSPSRQHIVTLQTNGSGTRFSLVALDLPQSGD